MANMLTGHVTLPCGYMHSAAITAMHCLTFVPLGFDTYLSTQVMALCINKKKCANQINHKFMNENLPGLDFHENVKKALVLFEIAPICT